MTQKLKVVYYEDAISIEYGMEEVCYWSIDEWDQDPQVVFSICNAIQKATEDKEGFLNEFWYYD